MIVKTALDRPWSQYFCCVLAGGTESTAPKLGSCTQRNGNVRAPSNAGAHSCRQLSMSERNSGAYAFACASLLALDSPWYQITPLIGKRSSGWIMRS